MKRMLLVLMVGLVMGADEKKELNELKGTWNITAFESGGDTPPEIKGTFTFEGHDMKIKLGDRDHMGTFKLDGAKKPKEIDVTPGDGPDAGKVMKGIYSITKDELKLALAHADGERPKSFDKPEEKVIVITLKKATK
jgi:uncharacterized protein (TIGR03067 family)